MIFTFDLKNQSYTFFSLVGNICTENGIFILIWSVVYFEIILFLYNNFPLFLYLMIEKLKANELYAKPVLLLSGFYILSLISPISVSHEETVIYKKI